MPSAVAEYAVWQDSDRYSSANAYSLPLCDASSSAAIAAQSIAAESSEAYSHRPSEQFSACEPRSRDRASAA